MTKEEVLQNCKIEGTIIKLPAEKLDYKLFKEVAESLELIRSKWKGNKVMEFVFNEDSTELLKQISTIKKVE